MQQRLHCTGIIYQLKQDRMCNCNTVTRDAITIAIWSGLRPDTPHQCVRAQCGFRFFRFLAHSLTTFGRWGCGERRISLDPVGIFFFFAVEQSVIAVRQGAVPYAGW